MNNQTTNGINSFNNTPKPCPTCGHCPTCGNTLLAPAVPYPPFIPYCNGKIASATNMPLNILQNTPQNAQNGTSGPFSTASVSIASCGVGEALGQPTDDSMPLQLARHINRDCDCRSCKRASGMI